MTHQEEVEQDMGKILSRIPTAFLGLMVTIIINGVFVVSSWTLMTARVDTTERDLKAVQAEVTQIKEGSDNLKNLLTRFDERQKAQTDAIKEIKDLIKEGREKK